MKHAAILSLLSTLLACAKPASEENISSLQQLLDKQYTLSEPHTVCGSLEAYIAHAPWLKNEPQPPHLLLLGSTSDTQQQFSLGIDRSPDFLFRPSEIFTAEHHFYYAHSRLFAYSCTNNKLEQIQFDFPENYQAQDAQSGIIKKLTENNDGEILVEVVDAGVLKLKANLSKIMQVQ